MENERQTISSATALLDTLADIAHNSGDVGHISADEMRNASSNADKALDALSTKAARTDALEAENAALVKERDALKRDNALLGKRRITKAAIIAMSKQYIYRGDESCDGETGNVANFAEDLCEQFGSQAHDKASHDTVRCARMGYGSMSYGDCVSPETGEPGIIFMELDAPREIGASTNDVYPEGSLAPADKVIAYISFANPEAVNNVITELARIREMHWPNATPQQASEQRAPVGLAHERRKRIASIVHTDCALIPGATFYNAAEMAIDAVLAAHSVTKAASDGAEQESFSALYGTCVISGDRTEVQSIIAQLPEID